MSEKLPEQKDRQENRAKNTGKKQIAFPFGRCDRLRRFRSLGLRRRDATRLSFDCRTHAKTLPDVSKPIAQLKT